MKSMNQLYNLLAIKSIFELKMGYNLLNAIFVNIPDKIFVKNIINEIKRGNYGNITLMIDNYIYDNNLKTTLYNINDIKQFDFIVVEKTTIDEIKKLLEINQLNLNVVKDLKGNDTKFYRYWDNDNRVAVVLTIELVKSIKQNSEINLCLTKEVVLGKLGYYTKFTIEKYSFKESSSVNLNNSTFYEDRTYEDYNDSYAQEYGGYSDQEINNIFDGDPDLYWNIE
jgi:hypothetical protein